MNTGTVERPSFAQGILVATRSVASSMNENSSFRKEVSQALNRYVKGDWGNLSDDDKKANDDAVKDNNDRILAKYDTCCGDIYIITEADRSATTILYCDEY